MREQNLYGVDSKLRLTLPGVAGRPNILNSSYRVPPSIARFANAIAATAERDEDVIIESTGELSGVVRQHALVWKPALTISDAIASAGCRCSFGA